MLKDHIINKNKYENKSNRILKGILLISFTLIVLTIVISNVKNVKALGITPGRTTITFESGLEKEVQINVINNEHKSMRVMVLSMMQGDLEDSITLFNDYLDFTPVEESKTLKYKVELPKNLKPGLHKGEIAVLEVAKDSSAGSVGATIAVVSQLYVYVPCAGKCIETDLDVLDSEQNSTATFIVPVVSRGKVGIKEVKATIDIYNSLNQKVASLMTDSQALEVGKRIELSQKWKVDVPTGDYTAKVNVLYDGQSETFEKVFTVGVQSLTIESVMVNNFRLGEIAKLQILVENKWNQELKGVYGNLLVYNSEDQVMADIKSAPENVAGLSKKELIAYWDTVGVKEGEYNGKLMVKYGEKSTDKNLVLKIADSSLDVFGVGYAIRPKGGSTINITFILIVLVIILLLINIAWFIFFKRFSDMKKNKDNKK